MSPTHTDDDQTTNIFCCCCCTPSRPTPPQHHQTTILCILDGWGITRTTSHNPIHSTPTPNYNLLKTSGSYTELQASGEAVGLPAGQMGNSKVGHLTIGTGRVVDQELVRIQKAVDRETLKTKPGFRQFVKNLKESGGTAHVAGLFSPGGVHSHSNHIQHVLQTLVNENIPVALHLFLDGRDTPPSSAHQYLTEFISINTEMIVMSEGRVKIATISGRYYAMDRDKRWDRTKLAYDAMINANNNDAPKYTNPCDYIKKCYEQNITDEFIKPAVVCSDYNGMHSKDGIFLVNFRADRMRQLASALVMPNFDGFARMTHVPIAVAVSMTPYSAALCDYLPPVFTPAILKNTLGEVCAKHSLKQLRLAETEKYAHVTYFLNGGIEKPSPGEDRKLISSPKVATYDLQPEMSGVELTNTLIQAIQSKSYDIIVINYANPDMVGHTGNENATSKAISSIDAYLGQIHDELLQNNDFVGNLFVTADHGNAEKMYNEETQQPHTAHTTALVPFVHVAYGYECEFGLCCSECAGTLADVAPTVLEVMGIGKPVEMTGRSLFVPK